MSKIIVLAAAFANFLIGCLLLGLAFLVGGAGHGTSVVALVVASPALLWFPLLPTSTLIFAAVLTPPIFWGIVGALLGASHRRLPRVLFVVLLLTHYAALPILLTRPNDYRLHRVMGGFLFSMGIYIVYQVGLWVGLFLRLRYADNKDSVGRIDFLLIVTAFPVLFVISAFVFYVHVH
jgi:hypothetical protein